MYPDSKRWATLDTGFEKPMGPLFALAVDRTDTLANIRDAVTAARSHDYSSLSKDIAAAFRFVYTKFCKVGHALV